MRYPAYPNYKSSGVEWLCDVPEHWKVMRLRYVCRFAYGDSLASEDREDGTVAVYGSNGPVGTHVIANTEKPVIVVGRKGSYGKVNFSDQEVFAIDTTYFIDKRHSHNNLRWLFYKLASLGLDTVSKDSAVPGLAREDAYEHFVVVPLLDEQRTIADFLDAHTAKLDTLVAKKRELIEKLKEKRTALISRTVTCGLPPNAALAAGLNPHPKLKPSGIDWLGDVQEHWKITPMRHIIVGGTRNGIYKPPSDFDEEGVPMVQMSEAFAEPILTRVAKDRVRLSRVELSEWSLLEGDLLFGRRSLVFSGSGKCVLVGRLPEIHVFESSIIRVRPNKAIAEPKYLFYFLGAAYGRAQILSATKQVTISGIDSQQVKSVFVVLPSLREQRAIADYLDRETAKIDRMIEKVESAIEKLQEYRTALITAAVTGKIDVRRAIA